MRASGSIRMRGFCHRFNNLETKLQYAIVTLNAQSSRHLRSSETHLHEIIKKIVFFVPSFSSFLHCTQVRQFSLRPRNWVSKCRNLWRLGRTTSHATRCCLGSRGVITSVFKPCETISVSRSTAEPIATTGHGRFAKAIQHLTAYLARVRIIFDFCSFLAEQWINRQLENIVKLPKPSVDAKRLQPETAPSCT